MFRIYFKLQCDNVSRLITAKQLSIAMLILADLLCEFLNLSQTCFHGDLVYWHASSRLDYCLSLPQVFELDFLVLPCKSPVGWNQSWSPRLDCHSANWQKQLAIGWTVRYESLIAYCLLANLTLLDGLTECQSLPRDLNLFEFFCNYFCCEPGECGLKHRRWHDFWVLFFLCFSRYNVLLTCPLVAVLLVPPLIQLLVLGTFFICMTVSWIDI